MRWLLEHSEVDGVVNVTSPGSLPNAEFMRVLRGAWGTPIGLSSSSLVLAMGAWMLRTEPELVLKSRWSYPGRLLERGLTFTWPRWDAAACDLCQQWRHTRAGTAALSA